jgi:catechol 2,3-dioxygenase-like lactoylglutathione lyase family enzyme
MIRGIKFANLPTRDQDRALRFWTEKMGFVLATDQPFDDRQRWIELRIPKSEGRVVLFTPDGHEDRIGGFSSVVFWTDDIDATYAELEAKGVETAGPPQKAEWGSSVMFRDPDGTQYLISTR